jgi:hypothetical protein
MQRLPICVNKSVDMFRTASCFSELHVKSLDNDAVDRNRYAAAVQWPPYDLISGDFHFQSIPCGTQKIARRIAARRQISCAKMKSTFVLTAIK